MEATGLKRFQDSVELWTNILSAGSKQTFLCSGEFWATRIFKPENQTQDTWIVCCIRTRSAAEISMPMQRRLRREFLRRWIQLRRRQTASRGTDQRSLRHRLGSKPLASMVCGNDCHFQQILNSLFTTSATRTRITGWNLTGQLRAGLVV